MNNDNKSPDQVNRPFPQRPWGMPLHISGAVSALGLCGSINAEMFIFLAQLEEMMRHGICSASDEEIAAYTLTGLGPKSISGKLDYLKNRKIIRVIEDNRTRKISLHPELLEVYWRQVQS